MAKYQQKMAKYYNKRVKLRQLDIEDLVLRKVTTVTKNPNQGKLGPTRQFPPRDSRRTKAPSPVEHRKLEEVPPVNVLDEFVLS